MNAVESMSSMPWSRSTAAIGADEAVGIPPPELREHGKERRIREDARREDFRVLHLARHDRVGDAGLLQHLDARAELAERDPVDVALQAGGRLVQFGEGLFLGGDDRDVVPLGPGGIEHEEGKAAVTGDQAKFHRLAYHEDTKDTKVHRRPSGSS